MKVLYGYVLKDGDYYLAVGGNAHEAVVSSGFHMTGPVESVAKPQTKDENGPNGFGDWAFTASYYTGQNGLAYRPGPGLCG
ncbi:hypothetical protein [Subdoligranulum variabile]|uniref:hypothetical protein n=1 Tax=Subdoligranulum variabile TaxID=214851 RepID=UPI002941FAA6|nr:hypothetical protein [Subdoligranulum variabile]